MLGLETALAQGQWARVDTRDPVKSYTRVELAGLAPLAPGFDWPAWLAATGLAGKTGDVIVHQPSYLATVAAQLSATPLPVWKAYLRTHLLGSYASFLAKDFVDARFAYVGTTLSGTTENLPRWKRGVRFVEASAGESLGKLYVDAYFPPASKARMEKLVANLLAAYRESIDAIDWMSPATKKEAQAKLATFAPKIGYPKRWIDYGALETKKGDLIGNVRRAREFAYARDLAKLGKPVDRDEWFITPQTVNAYYNASLNEIVFPASVLQPPFFDPEGRRRRQLRRDRRDHRPRDQPRLRRRGQPVRRHRQPARLVDRRGQEALRRQDPDPGRRSTRRSRRSPATTSTAS